MAFLRVAPGVLAQMLWPDQADVRITGAGYDTMRGHILLQVDGPGLPDQIEGEAVAEVQCITTLTQDDSDLIPRRTISTKFEPLG